MKISACIIAKNEEKNLPRLLRSLKGKFDEIILVDTGSTDRTVEIAESFGCKVFRHRWKGFADARNRAVKEATGDWLWHFDADFELEEEEYKKALLVLKGAPPEVEAFSIGVKNFDLDGRVKSISSHIFIHRRGIEWKGKVHESPKVNRVVGIPVFVNHYGYAVPDLLLKKAKRNLSLLKEELSLLNKGSREYNYRLFFLVQTYIILSAEDKKYLNLVIEHAKEFLENAKKEPEEYGFFLVFMYNYYGRALWKLDKYEELRRVIKEFRELGFKLPEISFLAYLLSKKENKADEAVDNLVDSAVLFDMLSENPFSLKWGGVSEFLPLFENEILNKEPPKVSEKKIRDIEKLWRKKGGRNLGLLVFWLTRKERVLKKLVLKYQEDLLLYALLVNELVKSSKKDEVEKFSRMGLKFSELFAAQLYEWEGRRKEALCLFLTLLQKKPSKLLFSYLLGKYPELSKILSASDDNGK